MEFAWTRNIKYAYEYFTNITMRGHEENKIDWNNLPLVALVEVFRYLPDVDRVNAALACEPWYRAFEAPCLWRSKTFELGGFRAQSNGDKAVKYTERFGQHLRYLLINCSHPSFHTCRLFKRTLEDVFTSLKEENTQLLEFELCRLELERYWKYDTPREKIVAIFSKFFKTQKRMFSFDMTAAKFPAFGGCRVLDSLANHSGSTIQDMLIEDFFHSRLEVYRLNKFQKLIGKFTNLKYLSLNYNCLSEEILETFSKSLQNNLEFINIKVFRNDPHTHKITGFCWRQLHMACPRMRVAFWFESIGSNAQMTSILLKEAPVKDVHIWTGYDDDTNWRLADTITHIKETYQNGLENISLELDNTQEIVDAEILSLITKCKRLREFSLNALIGIETVEEICELLRQKKIELSKLHVTISGIPLHQEEIFAHVRQHYSEILFGLGIDFQLHRFDF